MEKLAFLKFENEKDYEQYVNLIKSLAKEETIEDKKRHQNIVCTQYFIYCLPMSSVRSIAKDIYKKGNYKNFLAMSKHASYEEVMIEGLVCSYIKNVDEYFSYINKWLKYVDCWAHTDSCVAKVKAYENSEKSDYIFEKLYKMSLSSKEFVARFGIVSIMDYFLKEPYFDKIVSMCESITHQGYYVKMAIAWLISFMFMKNKDVTYKLLERKCLDKFIQNKAISKCRDSYQVSESDKENLSKLRIK